MRIAVTGSTGQLGRAVTAAARADGHEVLGLARTEAEPCDLTDRSTVDTRLRAWAPDLVVHAAGWTDVDGCERDPGTAQVLNVAVTVLVADAARRAGAHLVYVSTNHVFDGEADRPAQETDPTSARSAYGRSKRDGELVAGDLATVVRTAWLVSRQRPNLVAAILDAASRPGPLRFVTDEIAQPTLVDDLAPVLLRLGTERRSGTWHAVNEGPSSAHELAREVLVAAGDDPRRVQPITAADLPERVAPRPRNGVLDTRHLREDGGGGLPHHRDQLRALVEDLRSR
ncbi:MAG: rmlD [Ilumatobacteraceae bacterium]|nr:rmlD [Ilumatobacteraceae bacterium]